MVGAQVRRCAFSRLMYQPANSQSSPVVSLQNNQTDHGIPAGAMHSTPLPRQRSMMRVRGSIQRRSSGTSRTRCPSRDPGASCSVPGASHATSPCSSSRTTRIGEILDGSPGCHPGFR
ncbi:hypothetical protein CQ040_17335 [Microbacterium sp. MYb54]|nr:hypothetical protein CQ032_16745 [Microbacterium sp. MYb43]PQZ74356.1 hypothetical protein CQ031_15935 [Microbacterium sp. MYb40]PRB18141.1 hypothetical protein CQ040_17335 [Microbacterium sp. MYb54]PRB23484.1 hypothetical protein CQ037_17535 [Microbacterium sp. MYb50]PRB62119.1 hypothetical protein CQ021_17350 [Microbacterium sp. MYb24]PRB71107.1 hypothetical protein CQ027_16220 [Microbacterium sp. MYb32]